MNDDVPVAHRILEQDHDLRVEPAKAGGEAYTGGPHVHVGGSRAVVRHRDAAPPASGDTGDHEPAGVEDCVTRAQRVERERVRLFGEKLGDGLRRHCVERRAGLLRGELVGKEFDSGSDRGFGPACNSRGSLLHGVGTLPEAVAERLSLHTKGDEADGSGCSTNQ